MGRFLPLVFGREIRASKHDVKRSRSESLVGFEPALSRCRFLVCLFKGTDFLSVTEPLGYGVLYMLERGNTMFEPGQISNTSS